jgi:hypothetical protein
MFIAAHWHSGGSIHPCQPVQPEPAKHPMHHGGGHPQTERRSAPALGVWSAADLADPGRWRLLWAVMGSAGKVDKARPAHLAIAAHFPVRGRAPDLNRSAARATGQPASTTRRTSRQRPSADSGALEWTTRTSWVGADAIAAPHLARRSSSRQTTTAVINLHGSTASARRGRPYGTSPRCEDAGMTDVGVRR